MRRRLSLLVMALGSACVPGLEVPDGAQIECLPGECPTGFHCVEALGLCVADGADETSPSLDGVPTVDSSPAMHGSTVLISFRSQISLGQNPTVRLRSPSTDAEAQFDSNSGLDYVYSFTPDEALHGAGAYDLVINMVGENGISSGVTLPGQLFLDFENPTVVASTTGLNLEVAPGNPLLGDVQYPPTAATDGTTVRVFFSLSEPLAADPPVRLVENPTAVFTYVSNVGTFYTYELTIDSSILEQTYSIEVVPEDLAGNTEALPLADLAGSLTVTVDRSTPAAPDVNTDGRILYTRVPWGAVSTGGLPELEVTGLSNAVEPSSVVVALTGADIATAQQIARTRAGGNGAFGAGTVGGERWLLNSSDRPLLYLASIDGAGNASVGVAVRNVRWLASYEGRVQGQSLGNPNRVGRFSSFDAVAVPSSYGELTTPEIDDVSEVGTAVDATSIRRWSFGGNNAPSFAFATPTYDTARGEVFLFGSPSTGAPSELWTYSRDAWRPLSTVGLNPGNIVAPATLYDAVRDRMIILNADPGAQSAQTTVWEWTGATWVNPEPIDGFHAPVRGSPAVVLDAARGSVLTYGGYSSDNPASCPAGSIPAPTLAPICVWEGGWIWDGQQWTATPGGGPSHRAHSAMTYDEKRGVVVLFGGCEGYFFKGCDETFNDVWEWNGTSWTEITPMNTLPPGRWGHGMTWDPDREQVIVHGGVNVTECAGLLCVDTWAWDGSNWTEIVTTGTPPGSFLSAGLTYDRAQERLIYMPSAGFVDCDMEPETCGALWELRGTHWTKLSHTAEPTPAIYGSMATAVDRGTVIRFGGCDQPNSDCGANGTVHTNETWEWNGYVWTQRCEDTMMGDPDYCGSSLPSPRASHGAVYDQASGTFYVFGGFQADPQNWWDDLWAWDGSTWGELCGAACSPRPAARRRLGMAFDEQRDRLVVFGGSTTGGACTGGAVGNQCGDTWEWGAWGTGPCGGPAECWMDVTPGGVSPPARISHALAYDEAREVVVLFGGVQDFVAGSGADCGDGTTEVGGRCLYNDTWEWDGTTWDRKGPTTPGDPTFPPAREGHALVYDHLRGRTVLVGGRVAFATPNLQDVWEWDGVQWREVFVPAPRADVELGATAAFDPVRQKIVTHGYNGGTQLLDASPNQRPGFLLEFAWLNSSADASWITSARLNTNATATGYTVDLDDLDSELVGEAVPGVEVAVWTSLTNRWETVSSGPDAGWSVVVEGDTEAQNWVAFTDHHIQFSVMPTLGDGNGATPASVSLDYAELEIHYRRP